MASEWKDDITPPSLWFDDSDDDDDEPGVPRGSPNRSAAFRIPRPGERSAFDLSQSGSFTLADFAIVADGGSWMNDQTFRVSDEPVTWVMADQLTTEDDNTSGEVHGRECVICMDAPRSTRFGPCGHSQCCEPCARELLRRDEQRCPSCRNAIREVTKNTAIALEHTFAGIFEELSLSMS